MILLNKNIPQLYNKYGIYCKKQSKQTPSQDWRCDSAVKSPCSSSRGSELHSQHAPVSQLPGTLTPGNQMPSSGLFGQLYSCAHRQRWRVMERKRESFPPNNKSKINNPKGKVPQDSGLFYGSWVPRHVRNWRVTTYWLGSLILSKSFSAGVWLGGLLPTRII